ncbi:MAG TPA: hypothetical protein VLV48_01715, partial [Thermoanaerobaculia bacterium]|nr:hypothetical protein [Thermoanaerobaculia bacterium]
MKLRLAWTAALLLVAGALVAEILPIEPGSVWDQNVQEAIKFLRNNGHEAEADEIQKHYDDGRISVDTSMGSNGETDNWSNDVTISDEVIGHSLPINRHLKFDPVADYARIAALARTLLHENIHANHQNYLYHYWSWVPGETVKDTFGLETEDERDAWRESIHAMRGWIDDLIAQIDLVSDPRRKCELLRKLRGLLTEYQSYIGSYANDNAYFGSSDQAWIAEEKEFVEREIARTDAAMRRFCPRPPQQQEPPVTEPPPSEPPPTSPPETAPPPPPPPP